jgi:hypothetical protein
VTSAVRGHRQGVAGVIVDEAQDLGVGGISQPPVGEIGLRAFVGQLGGKPDVGGLGAVVGCLGDQSCAGRVAADGGRRHGQLMMMLQVPGDGVGAVVESFAAELCAQLDNEINRGGPKPRGWDFTCPGSSG